MGTSCHFYPNHRQGKDHPHACGDKGRHYNKLIFRPGSSPRVWGQAQALTYSTQFARIIPTRVGTRRCTRQTPYQCQDHPHACGDKSVCCGLLLSERGSSPRVWGQAKLSCKHCCATRIIPTRVGTSSFLHFNQSFFEDHPHACGDKSKRASLISAR